MFVVARLTWSLKGYLKITEKKKKDNKWKLRLLVLILVSRLFWRVGGGGGGKIKKNISGAFLFFESVRINKLKSDLTKSTNFYYGP